MNDWIEANTRAGRLYYSVRPKLADMYQIKFTVQEGGIWGVGFVEDKDDFLAFLSSHDPAQGKLHVPYPIYHVAYGITSQGTAIYIHSVMLRDGSVWDALNGWNT